MVNWRQSIAAECVARAVVVLPDVSPNSVVVSFKRGFSPPILVGVGYTTPQACIGSLTRDLADGKNVQPRVTQSGYVQ